ncbi:MAG: hypothetical protein OEZ06_24675 [Myxococcales bacterium]|nr:hypothetical protein [Myxococcales bacterium]
MPTQAVDLLGLKIKGGCDVKDSAERHVSGLITSGGGLFGGELVLEGCDGPSRSGLRAEIVARMIQSRYTFKLKGSNGTEKRANLFRHIAARIRIVNRAMDAEFGFLAGDVFESHANPEIR